MTNAFDIVGEQMKIINQGLHTEEKRTEGGDEDQIRNDESERDFFPAPNEYLFDGEEGDRSNDWDR